MPARARSNSVSARFSAAADTYDESAAVQLKAAGHLVGLIKAIPSPDRILEIGCGTGLLTRMLSRVFPDAAIEAVDIAEALVEAARRRLAGNDRIRFRTSDALSLPVNCRFPMIVSSSSVHWITPLGGLFEKLGKLLSNEGHLAFSAMLNGTLAELHESRERTVLHKSAYERLPNEEEVIDALSGAGFEVARQEQETLRADYPCARDFLSAIHNLGVTGGPVSSPGMPLTRGELDRLVSDYDAHYRNDQGGVFATYQVLYVVARNSREEKVDSKKIRK